MNVIVDVLVDVVADVVADVDLILQTIRTSAMRVIHKPVRKGCASRFALLCND